MKAKTSFYVANLISGSSDSRPSNITKSDLGKPGHINELVKKKSYRSDAVAKLSIGLLPQPR